MIASQAIPLSAEPLYAEHQDNFLKSARFEVSEGEILKLHCDALDSIEAADKRGVLCVVRFFDEQGELINCPYIGTALSTTYGRFIYFRSYHEKESKGWQLNKLLLVPHGAKALEVCMYPFKASKKLRIIGEIQCFVLPSMPTTQHYCQLEVGCQNEQREKIFSFWSGLYSFAVEKNQNSTNDVLLKLTFVGKEEQAIDMKTALCVPMFGEVEIIDDGLLIFPVLPETAMVSNNHRFEALVQIVPPANVTDVVVSISNEGENSAIIASYKIYKFDTLIEGRFASDSAALTEHPSSLPHSVLDLSFTELLRKNSDSSSMLEKALAFYQLSGTMAQVTSIANHILSVSTIPELCSKARLSLAYVRSYSFSWLPSVGRVGVSEKYDNEQGANEKLVVAHLVESPDSEYIQVQKNYLEHIKAIIITPLGFPHKGELGLPWERIELDGFDCFLLNCVGVEQLASVPITSQLNFTAVLTKSIFLQEKVDLIHVEEGEDSIAQLLVGVALSHALKKPIVYQKKSFSSDVLQLYMMDSVEEQTLAQQRVSREFQCMQIVDAIIVTLQEHRDKLVNAGIDKKKIFVLPLLRGSKGGRRRGAKSYMRPYDYARRIHGGA